jgi:hypothetical protein
MEYCIYVPQGLAIGATVVMSVVTILLLVYMIVDSIKNK